MPDNRISAELSQADRQTALAAVNITPRSSPSSLT